VSFVRLRWTLPARHPFSVAPAVLYPTRDGSLVLPPEAVTRVQPVAERITVAIDIPGRPTYQRNLSLKPKGLTEIFLSESDVPRAETASQLDSDSRFNIVAWNNTGFGDRAKVKDEPPGTPPMGMRWRALALEIGTTRSPKRLVAVPPTAPMGAGEARLAPLMASPQILPFDARAVLILDYLADGRYELASAAAKTLQALRGTERLIEWTSESYEQLLIGYAFAMANERRHLGAWVDRTAAQRNLGADGITLWAYGRWLEGDDASWIQAMEELTRREPPALSIGLELGLRLCDIYLLTRRRGSERGSNRTTDEQTSDSLIKLRDDLLWLSYGTPPRSGTVSVPVTRLKPKADGTLATLTRLAWWLWYRASKWQFEVRITTPAPLPKLVHDQRKGVQMAQEEAGTEPKPEGGTKTAALSGPALYVAMFAVLVWLAFTVFMFANTDSDETTWARQAWIFGSVEAVAFAAAGALFGTAVQRERAEKAEERAKDAEKVAEENRETASKGLAYATNIQAEASLAAAGGDTPGGVAMGGPGGEEVDSTLRRHAEVSRKLFGDLV
jgi:hypothetical protein